MAGKPPDDFDAVRRIVDTLKDFDPKDQERIIRWAREKLGLPPVPDSIVTHIPSAPAGDRQQKLGAQAGTERLRDIRSFIAAKAPQSDTQFAAAVAYYYRFEASETEQKPAITPSDVQEATRKVGRDRLKSPAQTLVNAHNQGYFDKVDRGHYTLNTVGENLVAMALPQTTTSTKRMMKKRRARTKKRAS